MLRRTVIVVMLLLGALLGVAGTASAHAQLEGSDPAAGTVVPDAPHAVTLTFGEPVDTAAGSVAVLDDHLRRVDRGDLGPADASGTRVRVGLPDGLAAGTYTVSYRVTSADTHPVAGTFVFSVRTPSTVTGAVAATDPGPVTGLLAVARGLSFGGFALGPGALLVLLVLWPAGLADVRARRLIGAGVGLLLVSTFAALLLQGVWAGGLPLSALWTSPQALDTHSRRFDVLMSVRASLALVCGAALSVLVLVGGRGGLSGPAALRRSLAGALGAVALALAGTWALGGHAAADTQAPIAVTADALHIGATALWLGGVTLLAVTLARPRYAADLATVLPRFSRLATVCVAVLVVTGSYRLWREVGTPAALVETPYGRLLLVKLAAVGVVLLLGAVARRWVARHTAPARRLLEPRLVAHASVDAPGAGTAAVDAPGSVAASVTGAAAVDAPGAGTATVDTLESGAVPQPGPATSPPGPDASAAADSPVGPPAAAVRVLRRGLITELVGGAVVLGLTAVLVATVPARQAYVAPVDRSVTVDDVVVDVHVEAPRVGDAALALSVHHPDGTPVGVQEVEGTVTLPPAGLGPLPLRVTPGTDPARPVLTASFPTAGEWTVQMSVRTGPLDAVSVVVPLPVAAQEPS